MAVVTEVNHTNRKGKVRSGGSVVSVLGGAAEFSLASVLRRCGVTVTDAEAPPKQVSDRLALRFGYGFASVRAGRLGHPLLLRQLVDQALTSTLPRHAFWTQPDGTVVDGLRAGVDPIGLLNLSNAETFRLAHLAALRGLLVETALLMLPLWTIQGLVDPVDGTIYPEPPPGIAAPRTAKLAVRLATIAELDAAFAALHSALKTLNPGIRVHVLVLPPSDSLKDCQTGATLRALAASWQARFADVAADPILDHLLLRYAVLPPETSGALGAVVAGLLKGRRLEELIYGAADLPVEILPEEPKSRRERRQARQKRRAKTNSAVICEDELLEAFS